MNSMNDRDTANFYGEERLFWVVDSREANEEIFECKQDAEEYMQATKLGKGARLRICIVKHAYREDDTGEWNYDDVYDTFETVKVI